MSSEQLTSIGRRFVEEHNGANYVAYTNEAIASDARLTLNVPGLPPQMNRDTWLQVIAGFRSAFPDIRSAVEDVFAEGDRVVVRWSGTGTQTGELMGVPASGRPVTTTGIVILRVANGLIAECWDLFDALGVMQQIGAIPEPSTA
jgi:steroid delta-isomerase-like uncharacterized protein